jgi:hypothetical protein
MTGSVRLFAVLFLAFAFDVPAQQQAPKPAKPPPVVSLKGFFAEGGVANIIVGEAHHLNQKGLAQKLQPQEQFDNGDELQVGSGGYVEVLLNPGSFLRLGPNARMRFVDLSPDNLKLQLIKGSMILEHFVAPLGPYDYSNGQQGPNDLRSSFDYGYQGINVVTPQADFMIARGGLYRCDIDAAGRALPKVLKGVAVIPGNLLTDGMLTALGDRVPATQKFSVAQEDRSDVWSRQRAMALVEANKALRNTPWGAQVRKNGNYLSINYEERNARMKEALTVSAAGGAVGLAESGSEYQPPEGQWQPLTTEVVLKPGDRVRTNANARAEIHLYPECYLLLDGDTEIAYSARPDAGAAIKLLNGSAMLISSLTREGRVLTSLATSSAQIEIPEGGIYRLSIRSPREAELLVFEGRATIQGRLIKPNQRAFMSGTELKPVTFARWT